MNRNVKLPPEVNRYDNTQAPPGHTTSLTPNRSALFVKNLKYDVSTEDLFQLFGKFGAIRYVLISASRAPSSTDKHHRQIRQGISNNTKGTAFVVYEDIFDAKQACDQLNGYNFQGRYLVVLYHQPEKMAAKQATAATTTDLAERRSALEKLKEEHGIE